MLDTTGWASTSGKLFFSLLTLPSLLAFQGSAPGTGLVLAVTRRLDNPVLTIHSEGAQGNKYGFEGGRVLKLGGAYHLFTSEMVGDPHWVKMRMAHWVSRDRVHWQRLSTLLESSGDFTGKDPRAALWSPMPVYNAKDGRWNLFYVAYQAAPDTSQQWLTNHEGRIWRAVSETPGMDGIDGPYKDAGIVLQRGPDSDSWEGLQGTDSFFPYRVGDRWYAFYGSAHTEKLPLSLWQVGLAKSPDHDGICIQFVHGISRVLVDGAAPEGASGFALKRYSDTKPEIFPQLASLLTGSWSEWCTGCGDPAPPCAPNKTQAHSRVVAQ